jgi:hypothetical protein
MWVPESIPDAARNRCVARAHGGKERGRGRGAAAVVAHLEKIRADENGLELFFLGSLGVSDQEGGSLAQDDPENERIVVRIHERLGRWTWSEHFDARSAERARPAAERGGVHDRHAPRAKRRQELGIGGPRPFGFPLPRIPEFADVDASQGRQEAAEVIGMRMRQHDDGEAGSPSRPEERRDDRPPRIDRTSDETSGVHEHGVAVRQIDE